jgi:hypothetical protein
MYCRECGAQNDDNAWKCVQCGAVLHQEAQPSPPPIQIPNYLVQSILCTIFCCLPFGIPAIVYAAQVNSKIASGDIYGAQEASRKAKMWSWISFGSGLVIGILYLFARIASQV